MWQRDAAEGRSMPPWLSFPSFPAVQPPQRLLLPVPELDARTAKHPAGRHDTAKGY